ARYPFQHCSLLELTGRPRGAIPWKVAPRRSARRNSRTRRDTTSNLLLGNLEKVACARGSNQRADQCGLTICPNPPRVKQFVRSASNESSSRVASSDDRGAKLHIALPVRRRFDESVACTLPRARLAGRSLLVPTGVARHRRV